MLTAAQLRTFDRASLAAIMERGHSIDRSALDDTMWRGVSLGLPSMVEALTWKTFCKVFHRDRSTGALRGWNVKVEQRGVDAPIVPLRRRGARVTFGHYRVIDGDAPGLLIDYGAFERGVLGRLRDPIVAVNDGRCDLLLGRSFVDLGAVGRVPTPSFFSLELEGALDHVLDAPAPRNRRTS